MVQDANGNPVPDATFMVSYAHRDRPDGLQRVWVNAM